jgi:hypothetical protein
MSKVISNYKIDQIATELTSSFDKKIKVIEDKITSLVQERVNKFIPEDIKSMLGKYPDFFSINERPYISMQKGMYVKCENVISCLWNDIRASFEETKDTLYVHLSALMEQRLDLKVAQRKTENRIKCTLSNLKSYKRIKDEFPEAYVILCKIDESNVGGDTSCDDIEKLRAELSAQTSKAE